jgi:hypothetical protein
MAIARYKDLCVDAGDPARLGGFWAAALGRTWEARDDGDGLLRGPTPRHAIWINRVPEARAVKQRVHLDIYARELAGLEALGATIVEPRHGTRTWTVMADPEGGEFCAFLRAELPAERLHGLVVDSADPGAQARWWAGVYGVEVTANDGWFGLRSGARAEDREEPHPLGCHGSRRGAARRGGGRGAAGARRRHRLARAGRPGGK